MPVSTLYPSIEVSASIPAHRIAASWLRFWESWVVILTTVTIFRLSRQYIYTDSISTQVPRSIASAKLPRWLDRHILPTFSPMGAVSFSYLIHFRDPNLPSNAFHAQDPRCPLHVILVPMLQNSFLFMIRVFSVHTTYLSILTANRRIFEARTP